MLSDLGLFVKPEISENLMSIYTFVGSFYNYLYSAIYYLGLSLVCRTTSVSSTIATGCCLDSVGSKSVLV